MSISNSINQKIFKLQREIGAISKDTKNPFFKSNYADINSILKQLDPLLEKYKLIKWQPTEYDYESKETIVTSFLECAETSQRTHKSSLPIPKSITDPQKIGSAITYFRRYTLVALLGLQAEDDDGNLASNKIKKPVITPDKKEIISVNHPKFQKALEHVTSGKPLDQITSKYDLTEDALNKLQSVLN